MKESPVRSLVKEVMQEKGVTILALVEATGLSSRTVRNARSERVLQCRLETLLTIANALGVRVKDLFEEG